MTAKDKMYEPLNYLNYLMREMG